MAANRAQVPLNAGPMADRLYLFLLRENIAIAVAKHVFLNFSHRVARLANALVASGVKPGGRVAVQVEKSPEALFLYFACLRAGAAYLPLNTAYTLAELDFAEWC